MEIVEKFVEESMIATGIRIVVVKLVQQKTRLLK